MNEYPKWKQALILISGICLLVIMGISIGGRSRISYVENLISEVVFPVQKGINQFNQGIKDGVEPYFKMFEAAELNQKYEEQISEMRQAITNLTLTQAELNELRDLKKALNYVSLNKINQYVSCNIISKDMGNWYKTFIVDIGSAEGVTKNSAVINEDGLVGIVYEVGEHYSKVVTIVDNKTNVSFTSLSADAPYDGQITGNFDGLINGQVFDTKAQMKVGDKLITSGLGIFPKGISIGEVVEVVDNKNDLLPEIEVKPSVDFSDLGKLMVIPKTEIMK
jgi:rod shape-determining protein MreC